MLELRLPGHLRLILADDLIKTRIYACPDGLERVWQYSIMPLMDDLFYGQRDLADRFGLASLRKVIADGPSDA